MSAYSNSVTPLSSSSALELVGVAKGQSFNQGGEASSAKFVSAAHEFEAQMMKELLKPLAPKAGSIDGSETAGLGFGSDDNSDSGGAMGEYATEALGLALSQAGGFGVAKSIVNTLHQTGTLVTTPVHADTQMKVLK